MLDVYAFQYNTGAHRSLGYVSPFEVFFGRKVRASEKVETDVFPWDDDIADWNSKVEDVRRTADTKQRKAAKAMVDAHRAKNPPSVYKKGEEVMVKLHMKGKKVKGKKKLHCKGKILRRKENRYQITYTDPNTEAKKTEWFPVSSVTSLTRSEECEKQAEATKRPMKSNFHDEFHLPESDESDGKPDNASTIKESLPKELPRDKRYSLRQRRISSYKRLSGSSSQYQKDLKRALKESTECTQPDITDLVSLLAERNLRIVDVPGDGNCLFSAFAHQIYGNISMQSEVRATAVEYIANNPDEFKSFVENSDIDEYIACLSTDREWGDNLAI